MTIRTLGLLAALMLFAACSNDAPSNAESPIYAEDKVKKPNESNTKESMDGPPQSAEDAELMSESIIESTLVDFLPKVSIKQAVLNQNASFNQFKKQFLSKYWELHPSAAVYQGYYKHDERLLIPNGALRAERRAFIVNELLALKGFDANQLNQANATDLAMIEANLRSSLWYIDSFREYEWNPALYNPAGAFGVILSTEYKPLKERLATIAIRLNNVPAFYKAARQNLKTPTLEHIGLAIQQSKGALDLFENQIVERAAAANLDDKERTDLKTKLASAAEAVSGYISWLEKREADLEKSGLARDFRIGAALYEKKFKHDVASDYSAEELYKLAVEAKQRLHSEMVTITKELWGKYFSDQELPKNELAAVKQLIDHLSLRHVERDKFVDEIRRQIPIIQKFMDDNQLLDSDPSRPLVVRLTPEYQRGFAGASVNAPGPYDATANTYYNVSPLDDFSDQQAESYLREYNHWILQILNIHEAIPGHYTQLMHANKSPSKIKAIFANGATVEGWAVYAERMMLEAGYGDNEPEMWLMYSKWNLRVVVNTILDYGVQVLGMERGAALEMLMTEAFQERTEAEGKWRRATVSQVQLTSYFTGFTEIYAFREQVKSMLGESFDLRVFHNKFLSYGNAPVPMIKALMLAELEKNDGFIVEPLVEQEPSADKEPSAE